jgi:transposase
MTAPVSNVMREFIVNWFHLHRIPVYKIATLAQCSERTVERILERYAELGVPYTLPRGCRPRTLEVDDLTYLLDLVHQHPAMFLDEIQSKLLETRYIWVSLATLSRTFRRLGYSNKQISKEAAERNELLRAMWLAEHGDLPASSMVWIDESGVDDQTFHRQFGWAPVGMGCVRSEVFARGERSTLLPALTTDGVVAFDILEGSVTKERFVRFIREELVRRICLSWRMSLRFTTGTSIEPISSEPTTTT